MRLSLGSRGWRSRRFTGADRIGIRYEVALAAPERGLTAVSVPNSGYLQADLRAMIGVMVDGFLRADGVRFLSTMVVEEKRHPELLAIVWQRWVWPGQRLIKEVLSRGRRRGELRGGINLDVATTVIRGAAAGKYLTAWPGMIGSLTV